MAKVQFNLLPDVKLEYNRTQRVKSLVYTISTIALVASLIIFLLMLFMVDVVQKRQMNDAGKQVDSASQKLKAISGIDQIITIQNQLQALPKLHQSKHAVSRIFVYLPQITPTNVSINKLDLDEGQSTMVISGSANSQQAVNTFVDNLKSATYIVNSQDKPTAAFPSVVESAFIINSGNVGYTINLNFDPNLFASNLTDKDGKAIAPKITVNQSSSAANPKDPASTLFNSTQTSTEGR